MIDNNKNNAKEFVLPRKKEKFMVRVNEKNPVINCDFFAARRTKF